MRILRAVLLGMCWAAVGTAGTPQFGSTFQIDYTWKDAFYSQELEVSVHADAKGSARLAYSGDSRGAPWKSAPVKSACQLDSRLVGELRGLLEQADVYGNQHWGYDRRGQDIPLRTIVITGDIGTVAVVVSGNESYGAGARCKLMRTLDALAARMDSSPASKECKYESLQVQPTCSQL